jgi:hypothetical protein
MRVKSTETETGSVVVLDSVNYDVT